VGQRRRPDPGRRGPAHPGRCVARLGLGGRGALYRQPGPAPAHRHREGSRPAPAGRRRRGLDADGQRAAGQVGRHRRAELLARGPAGGYRGRPARVIRPGRPRPRQQRPGRLHPGRNEMSYATRTRTLDDIAADNHVFSIIAMDQRNTLRRMFTAVGLDATDDDLRVAKADVARVLTPAASGLLSDPTYGVPAITAAKALAPGCGLLVAVEPSERRSYRGEPRTHRDPDLNARWVLDQGGDALKFFVQLRADRPASTGPTGPTGPGPGEPDLVAEALAV